MRFGGPVQRHAVAVFLGRFISAFEFHEIGVAGYQLNDFGDFRHKQDLYTLWENGHDDSFDFNVLWQKAVSIFIYCNIK